MSQEPLDGTKDSCCDNQCFKSTNWMYFTSFKLTFVWDKVRRNKQRRPAENAANQGRPLGSSKKAQDKEHFFYILFRQTCTSAVCRLHSNLIAAPSSGQKNQSTYFGRTCIKELINVVASGVCSLQSVVRHCVFLSLVLKKMSALFIAALQRAVPHQWANLCRKFQGQVIFEGVSRWTENGLKKAIK